MHPIVLVVPLLVTFGVSWLVERTIDRYDVDLTDGEIPTGGELARSILMREGASDVRVDGAADDRYVPAERRIELSHERVGRRSVSSAAIAAHEAAHAVQHARRLWSFMLSLALALPASLSSLAWFPLAVVAAALDSSTLATSAFGVFAITVAVSALRVAVEIDASRRALRELDSTGIDPVGARRVLTACGASYVADTLIDFAWIGRRLARDDDRGDVNVDLDA